MSILIKHVYYINPAEQTEGVRDILIEDSLIKAVADPDSIQTEGVDQVILGDDLIAAPGLIDVHVHFRDPGFTYKEDIETGAMAAKAGGFTSVVLMANTKPCVDSVEVLKDIVRRGKETGIKVHTCANVTMGMKGETLVDMAALLKAGAVGFTDDGIPLLRKEVVEAAMDQAEALGVPLSFHEEDPAFIANNGINAGRAAAYFGIGGSKREAEIAMVKRDVELALKHGADISIQHISTKEGVELVREAKKVSSHVWAEVTPHHFTLTEEAAIKHGTLAKMNPPLREEADRLALIRGLQDGTIDMIATDHAPHAKEEKEKPITEAPSGILGLETALSLGIRELVNKGYLTMMELLEKMTVAPARLYHLPQGNIAKGQPADLVLFSPKQEWTVEKFHSKSQNSPFIGEIMPGVVHYTICDGKIVYDNSEK